MTTAQHVVKRFAGWERRAFEVTKPFTVYERLGWADSNTYYGSSKVLATVYKTTPLRKGDVILDLPGGVYLLKGSTAVPVRLKVSEKHPFEKSYGVTALSFEESWPMAKLTEVPMPNVSHYEQANERVTVPKGTKTFGRNIDIIL